MPTQLLNSNDSNCAVESVTIDHGKSGDAEELSIGNAGGLSVGDAGTNGGNVETSADNDGTLAGNSASLLAYAGPSTSAEKAKVIYIHFFQ